jgi:CO/xanthine dehydrogenase Mo-binding subunit
MAEAVQPTPYIGRSLRRREDYKFLTGKGRYLDDIKLPGTLHLAILRSPHAHALITGMNLSPAQGAPGVRLALGGADLIDKIGNIKPNWVIPGTVVPDRPVMAVDRVRFVGECVALVVAETREAAHDALELIGVAYKVLPAVVDEEAAIAEGALQLHDDVPNNITTYFKTGGGDYAAAVRQADQVLRLRLVNNRLIPTCLERVVGDDEIDEAPALQCRRIVAAPEHRDFLGAHCAGALHLPLNAPEQRMQSERNLDRADLRRIRCDDIITGERQLEAAAEADAVHTGDDRDRQ